MRGMRNREELRIARIEAGGRRRLAPVACGVLSALLLMSASATPAAAQWYWRHPQPVGSYLKTVSFPTATIGWIIGDEVPLRTTDGGRTWLIQESATWNAANMLGGAFADESHGLVLGVSSLEGFIARTTDAGATWDTPWTQFGAWGRDVAFVDAEQGIAVVGGVDLTTLTPLILRTTDGGATWEERPVPEGIEQDIRNVAFADSSTGIATVPHAPAGSVLRTTDGGVTWELHETGAEVALLDVTFVEGGVGTVVGVDGAILRTTDGGETWESQDSGTSLGLQQVSFSDANHGIVLAGAGIDQGMIVTTADGGETWTVRDSPATFLQVVAFNDTGTATAVGAAGDIYRTTDSGQTWERVGTRLAKKAVTDVEFLDADTAMAVAGGSDVVNPVSEIGARILRTEDGGNTWVEQDAGTELPLFGLSLADEETGFAVGGTGDALSCDVEPVVLKTTNGGDDWSDLTVPALSVSAWRDVFCTDASTCTAVGLFGAIVRTEDGGESWAIQREPTCPTPLLLGVHFTDADTGTVVGLDGDGEILRTTDGGETWTPQVSPIAVLEDVVFVDEQVGFAVGRVEQESSPGAIIATVDGGETWTVQRNDLPGTATAVDFADASHGTVVTVGPEGGQIYRTSDGGASWTLDEDMPWVPTLYGVSHVDAETAMAGGGGGAILKTVGGPTFPLSLSPSRTAVCVPEGQTEEILVDVIVESVAGYTGTVGLSTAGAPGGVASEVSPESVEASSTAAWTLSVDPSVATGRHVLTLTGDDGTEQQLAKLLLDVVDPAQAPSLTAPTDGATDVELRPTFSWEAVPVGDGYRIQVATESAFDDVVIDAQVVGTSFTAPTELASDTQYFWRVQGTLGCAGAWSEVFGFVTEPQPLVEVVPQTIDLEVPAGGSDGVTVDIANVGTGELVWSVTTAQPPAVAGAARRDHGAPGVPGRFGVGQGTTAERRRHQGVREMGSVSQREGMNRTASLKSPLPGVAPTHAIGGVVDCDGEPGLVVHDDGTVENGYSGNPNTVDQVIFADRFTPSGYPASFSAVCVAFVTGGPTSLDYEIVVFDDDGPDDGPGTELGSLAVSADGLSEDAGEPVWFSYDISSLDLAIESGSVFIGARWTVENPGVFIAVDQSEGNPVGFAGGYWWNDNDGAWQKIQDTGGSFGEYRSLFVRAVENPGGCLDPTAVPWLSVTPESGSSPAGGSSPVDIAVDATGLDAGEHLGSLCIATNDESRPLVVVPIRLVATEGGVALAFDPSSLEFGDVDVGTTSPPKIAVVENLGSGDATGVGLTAPGGDFEADTSACGDTLPGGASCEVSVTFAPLEPGPAAAAVAVTSDQGPSATLDLAGSGVQNPPEIDVDPDSLSSILGEGETETQSLTLANPGGEPLDWQVTEEGEPVGGVLHPSEPVTAPATRLPRGVVAGLTRGPGTDGAGTVASHPFPESLGDEVTVTHSESMDILSQNTAVCANDGDSTTVENHFLRTFSLGDFGILGPFDVTEVTFGVQNLTGNAGIDVNLYTLEGELVFDNLTPIGTATVHLTPQDLTLVTVPVTGTAPAGSTLVVEIAAPDLTGIAAFLPGSNDHGETAPSYIAAETCGASEPTPYADIGFPGTHLVMTVTGNAEPLDCALPGWTAIDPAAGSVPPGGEAEAAVTFDATGLEAGDYAATLCLASNDPGRPLTTVPLALTVTPPAVALAFDPASLEFGDVEVGDTSAPQAVTLHNAGVETATGLTFELGDDAFAADAGNCGTTLPAGESCTVSVTFSPTDPGPAAATLHAVSTEGATADLGLTGNGVAAGVVTPTALEVDPEEPVSDGNGVFEPGELVTVAPWWRNDGSLPTTLTGTASDFIGPDGVPHTVEQESASYGTLDPGQAGTCLDTDACYSLAVGDPAARPATHWEATFEETLDDPADTGKTWTVHIGGSFGDVPSTSAFYPAIETLLHSGVTEGCAGGGYCPGGVNTRSQMPVFVLRALEGADYVPLDCSAETQEFTDVPATNPFCPWIEELARRDVVSGCGGGNYCPSDPVTRAQMAIFLLRTFEGADYTPIECTERFDDVPCASLFADWIEDLAAREITGGCSATDYCPADPVTRGQMAVFVTRTFGLTLYGP